MTQVPNREITNSRARTDGFYLMLLGSIGFVLFGFVLMSADRVPVLDFRTAYYCGDCLLHAHCDPYSEHDVSALYSQRVERFPVSDRNRTVITRNPYLPSIYPVAALLALLPFNLGQALWLLAIVASFIVASFLMWQLAREDAPILAGAFLAFCLANSGSLIYFGNPAGFVVPLCVVATWCFMRQRYIALGIACFAVSLAFKPHDGGLVWLYFLMAGGELRRRALHTLAVVAAFTIPSVLWTMHIAPQWLHEMNANLQSFSAPGAMNDPSRGHGTLVLTNLQTITSFFWPNPHAYNLAAYLAFAPLLIVWVVLVLRARSTWNNVWFALASIVCFSMLPLYHRQYDAKLIILSIPAFAILWAKRGTTAWIALAVTAMAFILNGDLPWVAFLTAVRVLRLNPSAPWLVALWDFSVPVSLALLGGFYLWVLWRRSKAPSEPDGALTFDASGR